VGQIGQEELHGLYWLLKGGGWWTERDLDRWKKMNALGELEVQNDFDRRHKVKEHVGNCRPSIILYPANVDFWASS
jgi:hypothetical protein